MDDGTRTQLGWLPVTGWNEQDGFMVGAALHNTVLPLRDFEWMAMPMYALGEKQVNGMARLSLKRDAWRFEGTGRSFSDAFISDYFDVRYVGTSSRPSAASTATLPIATVRGSN